ncbi:hypothetical protein CORC01_10184 [Colletotrichum orchidophilum]|uniref:Uncharacterized protein n=1 Tax=Colletotrichum orchidophilum TaxID=1209926 RepID=A0A1G4AZJ5_9PEZI|nr:uncharacterized protein CORC01_10184 [Colletotrichum orchidophilum]OHE94551.1 hypothetical protein CORC01_10184 [Colletotrichum orchidophilum]
MVGIPPPGHRLRHRDPLRLALPSRSIFSLGLSGWVPAESAFTLKQRARPPAHSLSRKGPARRQYRHQHMWPGSAAGKKKNDKNKRHRERKKGMKKKKRHKKARDGKKRENIGDEAEAQAPAPAAAAAAAANASVAQGSRAAPGLALHHLSLTQFLNAPKH